MPSFLRGLLSLAVFGIVFLVAVIIFFPKPCTKPIAYSIGEFDPRFGLSREVFLHDIQQAGNRWEQAAHKTLFAYNPTASFTINLMYDERQAAADKAKTITKSLEQTSQTQNSLLKQYEDVHAAYTAAAVSYQQHQAQFNADSSDYASLVNQYNTSGGAPPDEYQKLQEQQRALSSRFNALEQERVKLNTLALRVNALAGSERTIVQTYNATVNQFNLEFANQREFDQGEYTEHAITIYEFAKNNDLVLVLTHELGHALGIGHVSNPQAIMYYMVNKKNLNAKGPTRDDIAALRVQCTKSSFEVFWGQLMNVYARYTLYPTSNS